MDIPRPPIDHKYYLSLDELPDELINNIQTLILNEVNKITSLFDLNDFEPNIQINPAKKTPLIFISVRFTMIREIQSRAPDEASYTVKTKVNLNDFPEFKTMLLTNVKALFNQDYIYQTLDIEPTELQISVFDMVTSPHILQLSLLFETLEPYSVWGGREYYRAMIDYWYRRNYISELRDWVYSLGYPLTKDQENDIEYLRKKLALHFYFDI